MPPEPLTPDAAAVAFLIWIGVPNALVVVLWWIYAAYGWVTLGRATWQFGARTTSGARQAFAANTSEETRFLALFALASLPALVLLFATGQLFAAMFGLADQLSVPGLFDDDLSPAIWGSLLNVGAVSSTTGWLLGAAVISLVLILLARYSGMTWLAYLACGPWILAYLGICLWALIVGFFFVVGGFFGLMGGFGMGQNPLPVAAQGTMLLLFVGLLGSAHLVLKVSEPISDGPAFPAAFQTAPELTMRQEAGGRSRSCRPSRLQSGARSWGHRYGIDEVHRENLCDDEKEMTARIVISGARHAAVHAIYGQLANWPTFVELATFAWNLHWCRFSLEMAKMPVIPR